jgi:hypothetical protein
VLQAWNFFNHVVKLSVVFMKEEGILRVPVACVCLVRIKHVA